MVVLILCGLGWGASIPMIKVAVSEGYKHFGLIFWQVVISAILLGAFLIALRRPLPLERRHLRMYVVIAIIGTILPNSTGFAAAVHLPAGVMALCMALVPMFAFPIALILGNEGFSWMKLLGLLCGLVGVLLLVLPEASLPDPSLVIFIPLALIAPVFYGFEGNYAAKYGPVDLDPIQMLCGASIVACVLTLPLALWSGHWIDPRFPWGAPDIALIGSSLIHGCVYATYFWMVARGGAVFAAQVSYLVTGFGLLWSMIFLGETYSSWIWLALLIIFLGLFIVQPRKRTALAPVAKPRQNKLT